MSTANPAVAELLAKQDRAKAMEAEIMALTEALDSMPGKPGVKGKLIDREGFPRADVDIHEARNHRNRIACLQTDHVALMKEIEQGMFALHQATKGGNVCPQAVDTEPSGPKTTSSATYAPAPRPPAPVPAAPTRPFALIDQVSEESPASRAGLRVGDRVVGMGHVTAEDVDAQGMTVLSGVVRNHEGRPLGILVLPAGETEVKRLELIPAQWSGQGLLGCHLAPL